MLPPDWQPAQPLRLTNSAQSGLFSQRCKPRAQDCSALPEVADRVLLVLGVAEAGGGLAPSAKVLARPAAPAPTFTRVARMMGLGPHSVSPRSPERQRHAASLVSQAFKLPFYLNLCPRIQAEKGPFQSQFLLYGLTGDRIRQLLDVSCCSQHGEGSRGWHGLWLFWGTDSASQLESFCFVPQLQAEPPSQPQTEL